MNALGPAELRSIAMSYRDALRAHQARLNRLNVYPVPDGDTGTNMALTAESVVAEVGDTAVDMPSVCKAISHGSLMGARGNSGVILCQVLRGLTDRLKSEESVDGTVLAEALARASTAAYQAVMKPVEGTILTVVRESADAAQAAAKDGAGLVQVLDAARAAAAESLAHTPELLPVLAEAGVVDAGGAGFLLLLDVFLQVADGRPVPEPSEDERAAVPVDAAPGVVPDGEPVRDLRYEVMFFLEAPDDAIDGFKSEWAGIGDSIVVVGGDGVWNCHIHTDDAGAAIEAGIDVGRPRSIRITDLAEQIEHERCVGDAPSTTAGLRGPNAMEGTAVVAVGAGDGAVAILKSLGVRAIVAGGQSMNPSTAELLDAIQSTAAAEVVLLPNNRNVIPVAERARELATDNKTVEIVPTESLAEGFAALIGFDPEADAAANAAAMAAAAEEVQWGEVTWAVRAATTPAGAVAEGDHIGLLGHDIVVTGPDLAATACDLLDRLVNDDHELVTVVEGQAASAEATEKIRAWLAERRPGVTVEVHRGDQPLTSYLFSAE